MRGEGVLDGEVEIECEDSGVSGEVCGETKRRVEEALAGAEARSSCEVLRGAVVRGRGGEVWGGVWTVIVAGS